MEDTEQLEPALRNHLGALRNGVGLMRSERGWLANTELMSMRDSS